MLDFNGVNFNKTQYFMGMWILLLIDGDIQDAT